MLHNNQTFHYTIVRNEFEEFQHFFLRRLQPRKITYFWVKEVVKFVPGFMMSFVAYLTSWGRRWYQVLGLSGRRKRRVWLLQLSELVVLWLSLALPTSGTLTGRLWHLSSGEHTLMLPFRGCAEIYHNCYYYTKLIPVQSNVTFCRANIEKLLQKKT